ncbi:MAG: DNA double-strand break repair nuclease NurA, partial [Caldilinea sp.]
MRSLRFGWHHPPDRDSPAPYYLLNTGTVTLRYGDHPSAEIGSNATFYHETSDLYWDAASDIPMNEQRAGLRMRIAELLALPELASRMAAPCVAMVDGQLVMWGLSNEGEDRWGLVKDMMQAFDALREMRVPVLGYISNTASLDLVKSLRIYL